jgi:hypothetical protein
MAKTLCTATFPRQIITVDRPVHMVTILTQLFLLRLLVQRTVRHRMAAVIAAGVMDTVSPARTRIEGTVEGTAGVRRRNEAAAVFEISPKLDLRLLALVMPLLNMLTGRKTRKSTGAANGRDDVRLVPS